MLRNRAGKLRWLGVVAAVALLAGLAPAGMPGHVQAADSPTFWFHGEAADEANSALVFDGRPGTAVFDQQVVQDADEIRRSIDQCAIEVEQNCIDLHALLALAA